METTTKANNQKRHSCVSIASTASTASTAAIAPTAVTLSEYSEQNSHDTNEQTRPMHFRTQAEKKMDRILANRRSARRSRERKKQLHQNLQLSAAILSKRNEDLIQENNALKQKLQILSGLANQLTEQRQKKVASDKLLLTLLLQQQQNMQSVVGLNAPSIYKQNKALNSSSSAFLI